MGSIFSEIFGVYYRTVSYILDKPQITENEINRIISEKAFRDSVLFLPYKIIPCKDGSDWQLLKRTADGGYKRITKNPPVKIAADIHKRWLKSKLSDPKIKLFFDDATYKRLSERLADTLPLYDRRNYRYTDMFSDGDDFSDEKYRENFRKILSAVKTHEILDIDFTSSRNNRVHRFFVPVKLEYSHKNNRFRVYSQMIVSGKSVSGGIINIARINTVNGTGEYYNDIPDMKTYFSERRCAEPVTVSVTPERNGIERFMMEFASYEKHTEMDTETGHCTVKIWYDKSDETELLIQLLSFGPVIEILGPDDFRAQAAERIKKQYELLYSYETADNT